MLLKVLLFLLIFILWFLAKVIHIYFDSSIFFQYFYLLYFFSKVICTLNMTLYYCFHFGAMQSWRECHLWLHRWELVTREMQYSGLLSVWPPLRSFHIRTSSDCPSFFTQFHPKFHLINQFPLQTFGSILPLLIYSIWTDVLAHLYCLDYWIL